MHIGPGDSRECSPGRAAATVLYTEGGTLGGTSPEPNDIDTLCVSASLGQAMQLISRTQIISVSVLTYLNMWVGG